MDFELIQKLKAKRKEIAEREGKELFLVFQNATIEATVKARPKTKEDLLLIKGWGKKKIERYADEILEILNGKGMRIGGLFESVSQPSEGGTGSIPPFEPVVSASPKAEAVFSVSECLEAINITLTQLGTLKVQGEISDLSIRSGMAFFDLKDSSGRDAVIKCYVPRWQYEYVSHVLEAGLEVVVNGRMNVYKSGFLSMIVERVEPVGEGAIKRALEALKRKLEAKGYFDPERKRPIPHFIKNITLITSANGAALTDFRKNIGDHGFSIELLDVRVEGEYAENSIISAINWVNKYRSTADVLVVIRGGGGLENLKVFNSERIVEAILTSRLPVIVGIGHERDESIADLVADRSFSTPTAVAVFLRSQREQLITGVDAYHEQIASSVEACFERSHAEVDFYQHELLRVFGQILERYCFTLAHATEKMHSGLQQVFTKFKMLEHGFSALVFTKKEKITSAIYRVESLREQSFALLKRGFDHALASIDMRESELRTLNPEAILQRGYSVVYNEEGRVVRDAKDAREGQKITTRLAKGKLVSRIEKVSA